METTVVACETIEDEVNEAIARLRLKHPVVWLEGGLHNDPARLRARMQEVLNAADGRTERLVVTLGHCGGGVNDLKTGRYETVLPLADDCLSLLLGSLANRKAASSPVTYFLTDGWMRHENNVVRSYEATAAKYGRAKADRINQMMLKHYERFGLIDTGVYDLKKAAGQVEALARIVSMTIEPLAGSRLWLDRLLTGPYDDPERFLIVPPHGELTFDRWRALLE
ncbi:MAG: DUF1638 domain-containing protein [Candidatus Adiutrix sp.]|jgi:hypothetical protein|nr:DUF1638 domain-containing protein [Candidatus Adiutrix sp.]